MDDRTLTEVRAAIAGWNGGAPWDPEDDVDFGWRTVGEYLDRLDATGIAVNAAYLVPPGHRPRVRPRLGRPPRDPPPSSTGCGGWSPRASRRAPSACPRGSPTPPGMYASGAELTELCRVVAAYGGYYCPHHRSYGRGALGAYAEMVELTRAAGCALHLAHATMNFGENEGRAGELLTLLDDALAGGADITLDSYPYTPGCTTLVALLPSWAGEGGPEAVLARLRDDAEAERIRYALEVTGADGCHGVPVDWSAIEISGTADPAYGAYVGTRLDGWDSARRLLLGDRLGSTVLQHVGHEDNVRAIMRHPVHTGGSDGILRGAKPHPRAYGSFPHYLGRYVRELGVLSLEECVSHLSGRPAARLRLPDRGLVREGYRADLVLFDPQTVAAGSTYEHPRVLPAGIPYVLIDGRFVMRDGRRTDVLAGRSVRRTPHDGR
ncbi:D-aminoacylase [Streptomyces goshikiensis]